MKTISSSATKIVLLMFAFTLCVGFIFDKVSAETFTISATLVFGAYFGDKSRNPEKNENNNINQG